MAGNLGDLIEIEAARKLVLERATPLAGAETVPLAGALGRVLAIDVPSPDPIPGFDNSAMDGYAVRAADTAGATDERPIELELVGESRAGHPAAEAVGDGQAIEISTGAMLPAGADAVVMVERTSRPPSGVAIHAAVEAGANIRRAGEDQRAGALALAAGSPIGPAELGVLASVGAAEVECRPRPRVSVLTTGDELAEPGTPLTPGGVHNSNAFALAGLIERAGGLAAEPEIVRDDQEATRAALGRALAADVAIVSGGVSVGPHDHVRPALEALGAEQVFWGVALRPGKPTWFGVAERPSARPALVFGLPGNPVSAIVTFLLFVRPALAAMLGAPAPRPRTTAILGADYPKRPGRAHLIRCKLELRDDGWHATPTGDQGSHVLTSMLGAEALAIAPTEAGDLSAGERLEIELLPQ